MIPKQNLFVIFEKNIFSISIEKYTIFIKKTKKNLSGTIIGSQQVVASESGCCFLIFT